MPDIKNYDKTENENDLKSADSEKSGGINAQFAGLNITRTKKDDGTFTAGKVIRKRLPLAVDIIIALLFIALFAGVVVGAYYTFRLFANDYENATVEYVIAVDSADGTIDNALVHTNLYRDTDGSLEHFGKVKSISAPTGEDKLFITVSNTVRYKETEGYYIEEKRLAVGEEYMLRSENGVVLVGTVVELTDNERPLTVQTAKSQTAGIVNEEGGN
jgi:hypothetical protein